MKKSAIAIGATIFALGGTSAWAGSLTIPNTFSANTPAVAAEVNANFTATKTAVDDNDARITTNATDIATNAANITTNATDISTNQSAISTNTASIVTNAGNISTNSSDIATNTGNIATNTSNIATNTSDIATNTGNISTNTTNIATNTSNIATNTSDIATNTSDIATNTSNIATNATNITTNATAISALQDSSFTCPSDMARVGPICVDLYEASVYDAPTGGNAVTNTACQANGNDCSAGAANPIYARSAAGVQPAVSFTWFQAQQACANVNKRLLTNAEWQMAAAGTSDAADDGSTTCVTDATNTAPAATGSRSACVSNWGIFDMVGNVHEWVADWIQGTDVDANGQSNNSGTGAGTDYGDDVMAQTVPALNQGTNATNMPAAIFRGGKFSAGTNAGAFAFSASRAPSISDTGIGFRCAR